MIAASGLVNGPSVGVAVDPAPLDHPHLLAWREAFRSFGAKPKRYQCSAEALIRRVDDFPRINRLVDLYNAVSVRWPVPDGCARRSHLIGTESLR